MFDPSSGVDPSQRNESHSPDPSKQSVLSTKIVQKCILGLSTAYCWLNITLNTICSIARAFTLAKIFQISTGTSVDKRITKL